ncbi:uncharacterized protein LOC129004283 [Macrosteles quadrilineatus]|uniref:uncharacterized protein LOC129004283 n=1 Tax=Macrosteles quadrilineatus TaxID=74068 RepID=UPI0023E0DDEA|nr:uncharacterized protein LOC129004283 [Macrosteles quadrilineatus]
MEYKIFHIICIIVLYTDAEYVDDKVNIHNKDVNSTIDVINGTHPILNGTENTEDSDDRGIEPRFLRDTIMWFYNKLLQQKQPINQPQPIGQPWQTPRPDLNRGVTGKPISVQNPTDNELKCQPIACQPWAVRPGQPTCNPKLPVICQPLVGNSQPINCQPLSNQPTCQPYPAQPILCYPTNCQPQGDGYSTLQETRTNQLQKRPQPKSTGEEVDRFNDYGVNRINSRTDHFSEPSIDDTASPFGGLMPVIELLPD